MNEVRKILRFLLLLIGIGVIVYGYKNIPIGRISTQIANNNISVILNKNMASPAPDWTEADVLQKINSTREKNGFSKVSLNEKLNQAALLRLSIILSDNDYDGKKTGLKREVAVKNAGYSASVVGDLVIADFFKINDPIDYWLADKVSKETLLHPAFKEVGIAVKNNQDRVNVYIVFVAPAKTQTLQATVQNRNWGGIELWAAINKRRVELGVNPLNKKDELCTIASIRLNEILELNKLDGHAGFVPALDRSDLKWISDKYNISEFLAEGYATPEKTISAWENTLGHRALLAGGEYVWGCVYSQDTFAVAMAAY